MNKLRFFPKQRITLYELKWNQQNHAAAIAELLTGMCPRVRTDAQRGLFYTTTSAGSYPWTTEISDVSKITVKFWTQYFHGAYADNIHWTLVELDSTSEPGNGPESDDNATVNLGTWYLSEGLLNTNPETISSTPGWVNIYLVPRYVPYVDEGYLARYIDSVNTNRASYMVARADGNGYVYPYLHAGGLGAGDGLANEQTVFALYHSSACVPGNNLPETYSFTSNLSNISGDSPGTVNYKDRAIFLGARYWTGSEFEDPIDTSRLGYFDYVASKPLVGAENLTFASGDVATPLIGLTGTNLQTALEPMQSLLSATEHKLINMHAGLSAFSGVYLITDTTGSVSGYTSAGTSALPTSIGVRWSE